MSGENPISFRTYYEQFHAEGNASLSTPQEARAVLNAFIAYRDFLGLPSRPNDTRQGVTLIYKLLYHQRMMENAEALKDLPCADLHWQAALNVWTLFLYAVYLDDACHPDWTPRLTLHQRVRLWLHRKRVPIFLPVTLPRRACAMVWAVDSLRDQLMIVIPRRHNGEIVSRDRAHQPL